MLYIKAMNSDNKTYQILESNGYLEFKSHKPVPPESKESVEVIYSYTDVFGVSVQGRHWLEGDCFVMNESGVTISRYVFGDGC